VETLAARLQNFIVLPTRTFLCFLIREQYYITVAYI
jgi:hypothetical protein